ncbi:7-carboxy-7-deazaguanine synthase QueE [Paenibacillus sp. FSL R7-0048]|uniref:7-carboxy-7-deazaguanine synthase QueE n=1 Tax=Paenibacillus TaxID=44249 RepID=UPI0009D63EAF|nr:7-carboxy-7-deazaguanine synthase QueE [Paenibacillus odorifer]
MKKIGIYEMFASIQGEGLLQGIPSVLLRLVGCNLSCSWCDTQDFLQGGRGTYYSLEEIMDALAVYDCRNIVITGGEPFIHPELPLLTQELHQRGYHITIETNATLYQEVTCDLISMSPKLTNSVVTEADGQKRNKIDLETIRKFIANYSYQIKFVVSERDDMDEVASILAEVGDYDPFRVMIMPMAATIQELQRVQKKVLKMCIDHNMRYANRLQLQIWNNKSEILN